MRKLVLVLGIFITVIVVAIGHLTTPEARPSKLESLRVQFSRKRPPSVDHHRFPILQQPFKSPQAVTEACITCHNHRHVEVMQSNHWNWEREEYVEGRGIVYLGKKNAINNFCIGTQGNEQSCAKCHIGYSMKKDGSSYTDSTSVDCLVCHDNTDTYVKGSEMAGLPSTTVNLNQVAQNVGRPGRTNCGVCHFYGGGGNNVKHGDLDMAMFEPNRDLDVHMGTDGSNLSCVDCHTTERHNISGKVYSLSSMNRNRNTCEQCHTDAPHDDDVINEHSLKVACQSCHIPTYARANATKMSWDWSTAGRLRDGKPFSEDDSLGNHTYLSTKGSFEWQRNVVPDYIWFNGTASHYLAGDVVQDTSQPLVLNQLHGSYRDPHSKIIPVKIHTARQPFDPINGVLVKPRLFSAKAGDGALWQDFDWSKAASMGMQDAGLPYSGQLSFLETQMFWPVNHMVAPKAQSVSCNECHTRENGRLASLNDFYIPGRDRSSVVDTLGRWLILLSLVSVALHAGVRVYVHIKRRRTP